MGQIVVLPKNIAEQIAAGEVVERPASVVKELCENAVDAGAKQVIVELQNGGTTLIRVTDNGCGIAREDVKNAFLRNATSKVRTVEELYAIATLGFRGEALPSIAAMARVELLTRTANEIAGTRYVIEGGEPVELTDAGCPVGTTFLVRDLFYNTPARMKFLKSNRAEGAAAEVVVEKIALSHPEVAFRLIRDGSVVLSTAGDGQVLGCVRQLLSRELADSLIPVRGEDGLFGLTGYVTRPNAARGNRTLQNVFINGRFVRSKTVSTALEEACAGSVMVGRFPACFLYLTMPYTAIDVNVHPTKLEVRFAQERAVFDLVYNAVKSAVTHQDTTPKLQVSGSTPAQKYAAALHLQQSLPKRDAEDLLAAQLGKAKQLRMDLPQKPVAPVPPAAKAPTPPVIRQTPPVPPPIPPTPVVPPRPQTPAAPDPVPMQAPPIPVQEPPVSALPDPIPAPDKAPIPAPIPMPEPPPAPEQIPVPEPNVPAEPVAEPEPDTEPPVPVRLIGEAFSTYLLVEQGERLLLIDKHAAHERLLFEQLKEQTAQAERQLLLVPLVLHLSRQDYDVLTERLDILENVGFLAEDFGNGTLLIREAPAMLMGEDLQAIVLEIAEKLRAGNRALTPDRQDEILHSMACRAAVKAGNWNLQPELEHLLQMLLDQPQLKTCPHGRPIYLELTKKKLEREFGRLG